MELKEAIGIRRTIRFYNPYRPVEREKIQKMLEAARLSSFWGNIQALHAIVLFRDSTPPEKWALTAPPGTFQLESAPVLIVWYWLEDAMIDRKTGRLTQGDRLHELVSCRAMEPDEAQGHRNVDQVAIPFFKSVMDDLMLKTGITEMDCGQGIAQATLVAFEEGLGTCCIGTGPLLGPRERKMRKAFNLPDTAHLLILMSVGYPLESREAGGQRPKMPFEQRFFLGEHGGKPFQRDPEVVEELKRAKMIQDPAPLPWRDSELKFLTKTLGPGVSFDQITTLMEEPLKQAKER